MTPPRTSPRAVRVATETGRRAPEALWQQESSDVTRVSARIVQQPLGLPDPSDEPHNVQGDLPLLGSGERLIGD
jgi:hypothetical protein